MCVCVCETDRGGDESEQLHQAVPGHTAGAAAAEAGEGGPAGRRDGW